MDKVPNALWLLIGVLAGMGWKYLTNALRIPPYGVQLIRITPGAGQGGPANTHEVWLGLDDAIWLALGVGIIALAKKDKSTISFGVGFILGILLVKLFEVYQNPPSISPVSFAFAPIQPIPK